MKVEEHSKLLYLLDALQVAPEKSERLFKLATSDDATDAYKKALAKLRGVAPERERYQQLGEELKLEIS